MKIKVQPEGRDNLFIADKDTLIGYLRSLEQDEFHCLVVAETMFIGADWSIEDMVNLIEESEKVAVLTDDQNMGHRLAVITDRLYCFDIGKLSLEDLTIQNNDNK